MSKLQFMHDTFGAELTLLDQCKEKREISITSFKDFKGLVYELERS